PAARGFGGGAKYGRACFSVASSRNSLSLSETRKLQSGCRGALPAAQDGDTGRDYPVDGRGGGSPAQLSQGSSFRNSGKPLGKRLQDLGHCRRAPPGRGPSEGRPKRGRDRPLKY